MGFHKTFLFIFTGSILGSGLGLFGFIFGGVVGFLIAQVSGGSGLNLQEYGNKIERDTVLQKKNPEMAFLCLASGFLFWHGVSPSIEQQKLVRPLIDQFFPNKTLLWSTLATRRVLEGSITLDSGLLAKLCNQIRGYVPEKHFRNKNPEGDWNVNNIALWFYHIGASGSRGSTSELWDALITLVRVLDGQEEVFASSAREVWYPDQEALAVLQVGGTVTFAGVKKKYRFLVRTHHPDTRPGVNPEASGDFVAIQEAFARLSWQASLPLPDGSADMNE